MRYFEDFAVGMEADYGGMEITKEAIFAFARAFDPQPMHLDEEAAKKTLLKGLGSSGLHSNAAVIKMTAEEFLHDTAVIDLYAVKEFRWRVPVRPADRLYIHAKVLRCYVDPGQPAIGFLELALTVSRNHVETAIEMHATYALARRGQAPTRPVSPFDPSQCDGMEEIWRFTFTEDEMCAFAREFDPLPHHLDAAAGAASVYGGLVASPWYLCAQNVHATILHRKQEVARGVGRRTGPSPGWREVHWPAPARPGDTIVYRRRLESLRRRESRPDWGVQTVRMIADNQRGEVVFAALVNVMVEMPPVED